MLSTWHAYSTLDRLLDDVMNDVMGSAFGMATNIEQFSPHVDVRASDDELTFYLDVPGVKREDLELTVEQRVLTVKGQRRYEPRSGERVVLGRSFGAFTRSFTLPDYVDIQQLSAELADGVLTIHIPKQAAAKPRRIEVVTTTDKQLPERQS